MLVTIYSAEQVQIQSHTDLHNWNFLSSKVNVKFDENVLKKDKNGMKRHLVIFMLHI